MSLVTNLAPAFTRLIGNWKLRICWTWLFRETLYENKTNTVVPKGNSIKWDSQEDSNLEDKKGGG